MNDDEIYANDDAHPIPAVDVCDIEAGLKTGGADLVIVIASPMEDDMRSRMRLMKKFEYYLGYIRSEAFAAQYGVPAPPTTTITVRYHPSTSTGIQQLLGECRGWVEDSGATLLLKPL